jgi:hypothetical protein
MSAENADLNLICVHLRPAPSEPSMQPIDKLIQLLQRVRQCKEMFLSPLALPALENYLNGFRGACAAAGFEAPRKLRQQVTEKCGWKFVAAGPAGQMKEKGMDEEAAMDALLALEIEVLQCVKASMPQPRA